MLMRVSPSLINSLTYALTCDDDKREAAMQSFMAALRREPRPTTAAQKSGMEFERQVNEYVLTGDNELPADSIARIFGQRLRGASLQVTCTKTIRAGGDDYYLKGVLDALRAGIISDIKYTTSYEYGKFADSAQHPAYMELVPEAMRFDYLVTDGKYAYLEQYRRGDFAPIHDHVAEFRRTLRGLGIDDIYIKHWRMD